MELKGKCKIEFEVYFANEIYANGFENEEYYFGIDQFYKLPPSMQFGVLVDFFIEHSIFVTVEVNPVDKMKRCHYYIETSPQQDDISTHSIFKNIHEAREAALEKAQELFNSK